MVSKHELDTAIRECEDAPSSFATCEKLAVFYTVRDHLYDDEDARMIEHSYDPPPVVEADGATEFISAIRGRDPNEMWALMDELMEAVQVTNPRLYESVMRKINGQ